MSDQRDIFDRRLLSVIQSRVPLVHQPFAELAAQLGCPQAQVLERMRSLRGQEGVIREIAAIFDAAALGYRQALVAFRVPGGALDQAGRTVAAHPGVSHCYGRRHEYNLWFTLAVSPRSSLGLEASAARLAELTGATCHHVLPTLRRYKLDVRFGAEEDEDSPRAAATPARPRTEPARLDERQVRAVRALQVDLPIQEDPFAPLAQRAGIGVDELLALGQAFLDQALMRRYSAVLHHRSAGAAANVMVVWKVEEADAAGAAAAQVAAVSHCYLRPTYADWPWGLYTMIHGRNEQDCAMSIDEIATTAGLGEHLELWTETEYKKQRVRLFSDAEQQWEQEAKPSEERS
ncbi:MAG: hypothetical protein BWX88_02376 [Planctomycetes bacterium ADurb.Bin126]|nr:MAG: hypothetical protein BWX88_02376 [Planctomycetes bacterium ADurb.Bin126]HOD81513.1 Lrp/AsnC family transcriptional regulator [Phycisphaerae bacterium]HQL74003.1 Lrp/AsnC family transcriptional regulator [Phycisphaerae bacterium]